MVHPVMTDTTLTPRARTVVAMSNQAGTPCEMDIPDIGHGPTPD
ncbi:hypothetical protein [Methanospirillum hungatei]|nr:hypothetical protein [Methanospirillum hungatei]